MTEIKTHGEVTLAKLEGDLDHHTAKLIRSQIDREIVLRRPKRLVIDFSAVTFMDSSGIGLIMGRYKLMQEHGGEVTVARPPAYIKKVLRLAGIDKLTAITDDIKSIMPPENVEENKKESEEIEQTSAQTN